VTKLRRSIDELEGDLLEGGTRSLRQKGLSKGEHSLLGSSRGSLDHEEVFVDDTIVRETAHGSDALLSQIDLSGTALLVAAVSDSIDLLVDLSSVMITILTGTGNGPLDTTWMPGSDTSNLSKTFVGLSGKTGGSPTSGNALETFTLGDSNDVDHFVFFEDRRDRDGFLEETEAELDLIGDVSSVDLDFHKMRLLLSKLQLADLSVDQQANDGAAATDLFDVPVDGVLPSSLLIVFGVLGEGLLLRGVPVFVKSPSDFFA